MEAIRMLGTIEITIDEETQVCDACGGLIPGTLYWSDLGETKEGYCTGHRRADGFCGAFCEKETRE